MSRSVLAISLGALGAILTLGSVTAAEPGSAVLGKIGVRRGVCAVLGDRDAAVARLLARSSELTVFVQLDTEEDMQAAARAVDAAGFLGTRIHVGTGKPSRIGLADNVADAVLVLDRARGVDKSEVLRVLRPEGRAIAGEHVWSKPFPEGADDWSHHYHGPDNNTQSRDRLATAPLATQFIAEPRFAPGPQCTVASGGRVFMAFGHVAWHEREEPWMDTLVAVNGFNGTQLWRRPLPPGIMVDRSTMIATPTILYLADDKSCKVLDAATGAVKDEIVAPKELAGGTFWKWMALDHGVLYALVGEADPPDPAAKWRLAKHGWPWNAISKGYNDQQHIWGLARTLLAIDVKTKKTLWHRTEDPAIDSRSICMIGNRLFYCSFGQYLACVNTADGRDVWRRTAQRDPEVFAAIGAYKPTQGYISGWKSTAYLKCTEKSLYFVGPQIDGLCALSADDGHFLWKSPMQNLQIVVHGDELYTIGAQNTKSDTRKFDPLTGAELAGYDGCRRACTRATGTSDSIYFRAAEGSGRLDLASGFTQRISPMRPSCHVGVIVAAGHLYWIPWACDCDLQLTGLIGCGPAGRFAFDQKAVGQERLETYAGAAVPVAPLPESPDDWPTLRGQNDRGARSNVAVADRVELLWHFKGRGHVEPTAPVAAGGLVFIAGHDGIVRALDAGSGQVRWTAYTGGAVRFPPTIAAGRALVGSGDGWVYAMEAATGRVLWRFRAAPVERRIPVFGSLLSTWPVGSGVLVDRGVAYFAAGINDFDGTHVYAIDAATGQLRWHNPSAGHLDAPSKRGVACQGELLMHDGRLYLAGGNAVSPGVFDMADGRCLNAPPAGKGASAPRGRELKLAGGKVTVSGQPLYGSPDMPVFDSSVHWQPAVVSAKNADLVCIERKGPDGSPWRLVARKAKDSELWSVPLPAEPVRWAIAIDAQGRIVVTLRNGDVLAFGEKKPQ